MANLWWSQYKLVVGKNLKLKRASKCGTCVECLFPIIIIVVLIGFMSALLPSTEDRFVRELPPAGLWMMSKRNLLLYTPNDTETTELMSAFSYINNFQKPLDNSSIMGFATPEEMEQFYLGNNEQVWAGIEFSRELVGSTVVIQYALRFDFFDIPDTEKLSNSDEGLQNNKDYAGQGFLSLQYGIDSAILAATSTDNISTIFNPTVAEFNYKKKETWERYIDDLGSVYKILGPIFIIIALFCSCFRYLASAVAEKEFKIREEMRMMGLLPGVDNWAWWTTVMIVATVPILIMGGIVKAQFYHSSSAATILFLIFSELFSLFSLAVLVSLFVNKAKFAGVLGFVITIALTIIGVVVVSVAETEGAITVVGALFSPAAFVIANQQIVKAEKLRIGIKTSNLGTKFEKDCPTVSTMLGFIYMDIFLYAFLAWYIDNVFPGEFGIPRPPWFFVTKKYWSDTFGLKDQPHERLLGDVEGTADVEAVSAELQERSSVVIKNLRKEYSRGFGNRPFAAVDGLNLNMYDGQITAFLGHNGAGKTTTISMLTGLIPLSGGDAFVRGYSIRNQMRQVRQTLGICPQHDVIWPELSVYDHLFLYAGLKGTPYGDIKRVVEAMIADIGLTEKRAFAAGALSGGQKRKLCLAMAFIGGSDVIFLDEPTSGMDPVTRRGVWDFLNANKKGKTIVLTTHFMDEADFLGDRVAIISHGTLRCAGSSLFLKSRLGVGYLLAMVKNKMCDAAKVDEFIFSNIPGSNALTAFGGELSYRLPKESAPQFASFFSELDRAKETLGIDSYGVSLTTLEEVFLRIGLEEKVEKDEEDDVELATLGKDQEKINTALAHETKGHSFWQQLYAQLVKRALVYRRDFRTLFFAFFLPFILILLSAAVLSSENLIDIDTEPPLPLVLNTTLYSDRPYFYSGNEQWLTANPLFSTNTWIQYDNDTFDSYIKNQYDKHYKAAGAFQMDPLGDDLTTLTVPANYTLQFNKTLFHILPAEFAYVGDSLIRHFSGNAFGTQVTSKPFPHVLNAIQKAVSELNINLTYWSLIMMAAFCLIPAGFLATIVQERVLNVKRLLSVSGASRNSYWASNFIWDWGMFLILVIVATVVAAASGDNFDSDTLGAIFVVFLLYSLCITMMSYVISLAFNSYTVVTGVVFAIHFLVALAFNIGYNIVTFRALDDPAQSDLVDRCFFAFVAICPQFGFLVTIQRLVGFVSIYPKEDSWFEIHLAGFPVIMFIIHFVIWTIILLLIEYKDQLMGHFKSGRFDNTGFRLVTPAQEDHDVTAERTRLTSDASAQKDLVRVIGLRKEYPAPHGGIKVAVKNLSLGIARGECFGLLGMNGAGKSTTLGALSGDIVPTQGEIWLNGYNLSTHPNDALRYFGWCPQFDALITNITGREQLTMYARIKGLDEKVIPDTVSAFLQMLDLEKYANRPVGKYSGGNRRKLSLAVAMIGNPPIVFLDEPSTGMDPLARRYMWNVITALGANKGVIVTTHSMEECDALSSRIGIMSQGELVCLGTSQHLKSRFASGYSLQLKTKEEYLPQVKAHLAQVFPAARIVDAHGDMLAYELPQNAGYRLSSIFGELQAIARLLDDFSVSQTTLEQVFLKLAKEKAEGEPTRKAEVDVVVVS